VGWESATPASLFPLYTKEEKMFVSTEERFRLLDVTEVAKILNVSEQMVYKLKDIGEIPHVQVGRRVMFREQDVIDYVNTNLRNKKEEWDE
jgi:excisionase family DNA binding protein